ncbi:MAG TPA: SlyX family protein [Polyangiaceae bacterium]|jgi:SlyX protein|nr:SlyX family protein [Polyangiaceae bacterium]
MESRIVDLEVRYTHQERTIEELSRVVFEQQKVIVELEARLKGLEKRAALAGEPTPPNEPPPHY